MVFFSKLPFTLTSSQGLAFSSVTGPCEGSSLVSLRLAGASEGVRLKKVCLPSKDCPLEVAAGADTRPWAKCSVLCHCEKRRLRVF